ncbi:MAG: hypothetical protein DBX55_02660 [Verrucomicrobia bacterium]|nr:MAG: hypothetical protein DBX55_02660 [Verrucomicrobiota bacterium]
MRVKEARFFKSVFSGRPTSLRKDRNCNFGAAANKGNVSSYWPLFSGKKRGSLSCHRAAKIAKNFFVKFAFCALF